MDSQNDIRVPFGAGGLGDVGQSRGGTTPALDNARVTSRNSVKTMDSIRTITLREANRIQCKATRERAREKERLLREVRIHRYTLGRLDIAVSGT